MFPFQTGPLVVVAETFTALVALVVAVVVLFSSRWSAPVLSLLQRATTIRRLQLIFPTLCYSEITYGLYDSAGGGSSSYNSESPRFQSSGLLLSLKKIVESNAPRQLN